MTLHGSKGLEFPVVFIVNVQEGSIPFIKSSDHNEECRLLYVGMTRAKSLLFLNYGARLLFGKHEQGAMSRFLQSSTKGTKIRSNDDTSKVLQLTMDNWKAIADHLNLPLSNSTDTGTESLSALQLKRTVSSEPSLETKNPKHRRGKKAKHCYFRRILA